MGWMNGDPDLDDPKTLDKIAEDALVWIHHVQKRGPTPFSPPSGPARRLVQGPPSKSKFLAAFEWIKELSGWVTLPKTSEESRPYRRS